MRTAWFRTIRYAAIRSCGIGATASSAISSSQNMRASSRADSVAKRRSRISSGSAACPIGLAMRQHALDHAAPQSRGAAWRVDEADFMAGFERHPERGEGRFRQAGARQQRMQAGAAAIVQQRGDARLRQAGQFRQRVIEQFEIARQQRAQDQSGGELAGGAQMPHQAAHVVAARNAPRYSRSSDRAPRSAIRPARSALSQFRATTNCASVSDNLATSATRVAAGRSSSTSIDSRIAARWPWRSTMRSHENGAQFGIGVFDQLECRRRACRLRRSRRRPRPAD